MNKKGIEYFITLYSIGIGASVAAIFGKVLKLFWWQCCYAISYFDCGQCSCFELLFSL